MKCVFIVTGNTYYIYILKNYLNRRKSEKYPNNRQGSQVHKASYATFFTLFFIFGVLVNSWYSRMPSVRNALDLSALQLSQILIVGAIGSVIGLPFVGYKNEKFVVKSNNYCCNRLRYYDVLYFIFYEKPEHSLCVHMFFYCSINNVFHRRK